MIDDETAQVCATAVIGPLALDDLLFQAKKANRLAPLQIVNAERVVGFDHICAAATHTWRAIEEGRNQAGKPEVEFTRYLAGKRTIRDAIEHMGVTDGANLAIVVALGPQRQKAVEYFVEMLGLQETAMPEPSLELLLNFGATEEMLAATTPNHQLDIAMEMVAAVDLARS